MFLVGGICGILDSVETVKLHKYLRFFNFAFMKSIRYILLLLAVICVSLPNSTFAAKAKTLPPGTIYKLKGAGTVYFVASDAKAYPFPDEATFYSWYPSFAKLKVLDRKDVANVSMKSIITVKPGTRVIKFGEDPKLYAVSRGAHLRWIKNEDVLSDLYSTTWRNYFITLPANRMNDYSIGEAIAKASSYHKNDERTNVTISSELYARGLNRKDTVAPGGTGVPLIKSLTENLKGSFKPAFKPQSIYYTIAADYTEDKITLTPKAYDDYMTVMVGDYAVADGASITLDVPIGDTDIPVKVSAPDGTNVIYTIHISRTKPNDNALLSSLTENLADTMWPNFQPHWYDYTIYAKSTENAITLRAKTVSDKSRLVIDGNEVKSNSNYDKTLKTGENKIDINVVAENGAAQKYTITVKKTQ